MKITFYLRMLLVVAMCFGINNIKAAETTIWEGNITAKSYTDSNITASATWFENTDANTKIRIYATIVNSNNWKLYIGQGYYGLPGLQNVPSDGNITQRTKNNGYNGTYFEFRFGNDSRNNFYYNNGLGLAFRGLQITKVTLVSENEINGGETTTPTHKLTFKIDNDIIFEEDVPEGQAITPPEAPHRDNYIVKWGYYPRTMPNYDLTVIGTYTPVYTLHVVYDNTQGTVSATKTSDIEQNEQIKVTVTPAEGYEVESVTFSNSDGSTPNYWGTYTVQFGGSDITCTVTFREVITYTLTFKLDNEDYVVQELEEGERIKTPTTGYIVGYTFSGWQNVPARMPAHDLTIYGYYTKNVEYASLYVNNLRFNTYCTTTPLKFQGNEAVKAYIAKAKSASEVTLTQVIGTVAAGTGLLLIGDYNNATADIEIVESGDTYDNNLLVGVMDADVTINASNLYVLVNKSGVIKFADTAGNAAIVPAGKAYLQGPANSSRTLTISFDNETTAVRELLATDSATPEVYNLNGQRINSPKRGLYIINGKKVIIK